MGPRWGRLSCRTPHHLPLQRPPPALVSEDVHKIVEAQRGVARRRLAPLRQPAALPQEDVGLDRGLDDEPDAFGRPLLPDAADAADGLLLDAGLQARAYDQSWGWGAALAARSPESCDR